MNTEGENKLRIRFRLPNGEEFEAEGPREFIENQRNYFLTLIGTSAKTDFTHTPSPAPAALPHNTKGQISPHTELFFWEQIFKNESNTLILRHKIKLDASDLALLVLAGARVLLQKPSYSALELAKSFKVNGGVPGRLDRLLLGEIQSRRILAQGSKRSRTYQLSEEGFARAFILAEKLQQPR